jgi:hypothetical protein
MSEPKVRVQLDPNAVGSQTRGVARVWVNENELGVENLTMDYELHTMTVDTFAGERFMFRQADVEVETLPIADDSDGVSSAAPLSADALEAFRQTFSDWATDNRDALDVGGIGDTDALAALCLTWAKQQA